MALRRARKLGLDPQDGNDALYLLAARNLDVFSDEDDLLEVAGQTGAQAVAAAPAVATPAKPAAQPKPKPAQPQQKAPQDRMADIAQIQKSLVWRRRWRLVGLLFRLAVFVVLPPAAAGYYYYNIATDMYETESAFVIQTADSGASMPGLSLLAPTGLATSQDSIVVQEYLTSREAFLLLDQELGYSDHFRDSAIDPVQRLPMDASRDEAYELFGKNVSIGVDPAEGLVRMAVIATSPEMSRAFSEALLRYAEIRVDGLTQEARGDQESEARKTYEDAEVKMAEALQRLVDLQERQRVLRPEAEVELQSQLITTLEVEYERLRRELLELQANPGPNSTRMELIQKDLDLRRERIDELKTAMTQPDTETISLAQIIAQQKVAEAELETRQLLLQQALQQMETARIEANRQVRYLSLAVVPRPPDAPTHPRRFANTALAFLLFGAIYVFVSLTVSILREQISV